MTRQIALDREAFLPYYGNSVSFKEQQCFFLIVGPGLEWGACCRMASALHAILAAHFGVPIALVTGDQAVAQEAKDLLGEVECALVKVGLDRYSARCLHPSKAQQVIREAAERAIRQIERFKPIKMEHPLRIEIDYENSAYATRAAWIPTAERIGPRTVAFTVPDFVVGMKAFTAAAALPTTIADPMY